MPLPSVPTTVPEELIPKAMAVVDPLMFRSRGRSGLQGVGGEVVEVPVVVNGETRPTVPEFEMPFMLVPAPAFVPAFGPSKLVNAKPPALVLLIERDRSGRTDCSDVVLVSLDVDLRRVTMTVHIMVHRGIEHNSVLQRDHDGTKVSVTAAAAAGAIGRHHLIISL